VIILINTLFTPKGISIVLFFIFSSTFSEIWMVLILALHKTGTSLCNFYRLYINKAISRIQRVGTYARSVIHTPTPENTSLAPVVRQAKAKIEAISQETREKIKI
jgi:hypothetical protein